jgi:hypothetical protein
MIRRLFGAAALLAAVALTSPDASGFGRRSAGCDSTCASAAGACNSAVTVEYVDQKVTGCKAVWKTRKVDVVCVEHRMVQEPYRYIDREPVYTKVLKKVCQMVPVQQEYTCTVSERFPVKQMVRVCERRPVTVQVPYCYREPIMTRTKAKKLICETVCVPVQVACAPPAPPSCNDGCGPQRRGLFARLCGKHNADCGEPCAPCPTPCGPPCPPVVKTVMQKKVVTREVEVDVVCCNWVRKEGVRPAIQWVPEWVEREVTVWCTRPALKKAFKTVWVPTWVEKEVSVCTFRPVEREGVRSVCRPFEVKKTIDQPYCEMVPFETIVKVPVCKPAPCASPCAPTGIGGGCGGCGGCR